MTHSWATAAASSSIMSGIFKTADLLSLGYTDLSKYSTFEAFVAAYGKHMRDAGVKGGVTRAFVPIGSLLNYHPPDLDSHFGGPAAGMTKEVKKQYFDKRKAQLSTDLAEKAEEVLADMTRRIQTQYFRTTNFKSKTAMARGNTPGRGLAQMRAVDVTFDFIQHSLRNNLSFYTPCPHDSSEVVLFLTDSFFQQVAPSMSSGSQKPIESVALYLKSPIQKEPLIQFADASAEELNYHLLDQADFHIILDGQNRYQIIKQVLTNMVQNNWTIHGKKVHQIYIETLSYNYIQNNICDMALQIRNKSLKCDWFASFPQSNVMGTLNRNQSRRNFLSRAEVSHCSLADAANAVSPYNNSENFVKDTYKNCVRRSAT
jgi:hypothetical protein